MAESVLVVPRRFLFPPHHGAVQGFAEGTGEALLRLIREHGSFVPREKAEGDPSLKQIIPYAVIVSGRRVFLMSPLHHHFELKGWEPITVVVRFWLIAGLFVAVGVGLFYLEWVSR